MKGDTGNKRRREARIILKALILWEPHILSGPSLGCHFGDIEIF